MSRKSSSNSTIDLYRKRRWNLLSKICGVHVPMCMQCGKILYVDLGQLHVHHINRDQGHGTQEGGWQHLLKLEEDLENGIELEVLCEACHERRHNRKLWKEEVIPV